MKKIKYLFSLLLVFLVFKTKAQNWQQVSDFPATERDDACSFTISNNVYCGSGLKTGFSICTDFYRFNTTTGIWDSIAGLPQFLGRQYACGFAYNGFGYVFGGTGFSVLGDLWKYNPNNNSWTQLSSKPGAGLSGAACFVLNGNAYFIGGNNSTTTASKEVWQYAIGTDTWVKKNDFSAAESWRASAAALNAKGYLLFGKDSSGSFNKDLLEYDEGNDTWTKISTFPGLGRTYSAMQALGTNLFVFGGIDSTNKYYNDLWKYSFADSAWHTQTVLPAKGRKGGMLFSSANALFYTCGIDSSNQRLKESWKLDNVISVKELQPVQDIRVFPNPCQNAINIVTPFNKNCYIELWDCFGNAVWQKQKINQNLIDVSGLYCGVYSLRIFGEDLNKVLKISIVR